MVTRFDVVGLVRRSRRERFLHPGDAGLSDRLLSLAEHGARLGMPDLPALSVHLHVQTWPRSILLADVEGERAVAYLDHLALDLGEESDQVFDEGGERGGHRWPSRSRRSPLLLWLGRREGRDEQQKDNENRP